MYNYPSHFLNHALQNLIFRYLQNRSRVSVWLYENVNMRIEGHIIGFDEYMNLVLEESEEVNEKHKTRKQIGTYWRCIVQAFGLARLLMGPELGVVGSYLAREKRSLVSAFLLHTLRFGRNENESVEVTKVNCYCLVSYLLRAEREARSEVLS